MFMHPSLHPSSRRIPMTARGRLSAWWPVGRRPLPLMSDDFAEWSSLASWTYGQTAMPALQAPPPSFRGAPPRLDYPQHDTVTPRKTFAPESLRLPDAKPPCSTRPEPQGSGFFLGPESVQGTHWALTRPHFGARDGLGPSRLNRPARPLPLTPTQVRLRR